MVQVDGSRGQAGGSGVLEVGRSADTADVGTVGSAPRRAGRKRGGGGRTHTPEHPAEVAAPCVHCSTQAEIPLGS